MSNDNLSNKENDYICLNSIITFNLVSEDNQNNKTSKYILRMENSDDLLAYKLCKKPLFENLELIESLFYIRDIEECLTLYGKKDDENGEEKASKELRFLKIDKINQTTQFYLQHMISGKFITAEMILSNNKITLKLVNDIDNACLFSLRKINEVRSSKEVLIFNETFYLNIFIKEENQFYYVYEEELLCEQIDNNRKYFDIVLHKKPLAKFCLINQSWMMNNKNNIYSGQLTNIIFTYTLLGREEKFMLGVEEKKNNSDKENNKKLNNTKSEINKYKVVPYPYTEELSEHVLKKAFWVIEENTSQFSEDIYREPIKIGKEFRIKNPCTGLYLNIRQKNSLKSSKNINNNTSNNDRYEYEFYLVDGQTLDDYLFFPNNFKFFHYIINDDNTYVMDDGKYILKGICKNFNKDYVFKNNSKNEVFYFEKMSSYYLPISLSFNDCNNQNTYLGMGIKKNSVIMEIVSKNELIIKNEDDFIFNIKKIDTFKGNQVIFLQKLIINLEKDIKNQQLNINDVNDWFILLIEYLINLEYSFQDKNHETNMPIKERQKLLWKYNVLNIIRDILNYFLNNIEEMENKQLQKKLMDLLENIKTFLFYLSNEDENIKISVYVLILNLIVQFSEILNYNDDFSKLLYFIFGLINDSEVLQSYLIGDDSLLKKYISEDPLLSKMNINLNLLIKENKILEYIETNSNFLLFYQKLLSLNKIQYKKEEIARTLKLHMEQIIFKVNNQIDPEKMNYIRIIENTINNAKIIIKNNAILLDKYINSKNSGIKPRRTKFRNSLISRQKLDFTKYLEQNKSIKKNILNDKRKSLQTIKENTLKELQDDSKASELKMKKLVTFESKISNLENESDNQNIVSNQPLINKGSDNINKNNFISALNAKESEREGLLDSTRNRRDSRDSFRFSMKANQKGLYKSLSNLNYFQKFSGMPKGEDWKNEDKKEKNKDKINFKDTLNKLGKIWYFIKCYEAFDYNFTIFLHDNFLKDIFNDKINKELIDKQLFYFVKGKINSSIFFKNLKINTESRTGILYLFRLFNTLFPKINSNLEDKINKNQDITGKDILEDMGENEKLDTFYEEIINDDNEEAAYKDRLDLDKKKLNSYLCCCYSIYQFYINQYIKIVQRIFFILSNHFLNSNKFGDLKKIKETFMKTLKILLSKITFIDDDNNILEYFYSKVKLNPSLLNGAFNIEEIKDKFIQILFEFKKNNKTLDLDFFFVKEKTLVEYLFLMCQYCDEIKYFYEKITVFKFIRNFHFSKEIKKILYKEEDFNNEIIKQIKQILKLINSKRKIPILLMYIKLININKIELTSKQRAKINSISNNKNFSKKKFSFSNYLYKVFKLREIANHILNSLKYYEPEEFFNNIIYLENKEIYLTKDNEIIKKIRKIIYQFSDIENDILLLKINSNLEEAKNLDVEQSNLHININENSSIKNFANIYYNLAQIRNNSLNCFDSKLYDLKSNNILYKMLIMENKTFYKKIQFINALKNMIEAINYFKGNIDKNILGYISNLLRIFSKIKAIYPNFNKTIPENFELYCTLIEKSIQYIFQFPNDLIDLNTEIIFLNILYYGIESFLYIIKNCKMNFEEIKEFMEDVYEIFICLNDQFKTKKNRIIYQILYLFSVTRVLLYLNEEKNYDFYSYKFFYQKIFPTSKVQNFVISNFNLEKIKNEEIQDNNLFIIENENSSKETKLEFNKKNFDVSFINLNYFPNEMHTYKLESPRNNIINNNSSSNSNKNENYFNGQEEESKSSKSNESFEWNNEEEIEKLFFYVKFLIVYNLYLNEKNAMIEDNDENIDDKINSEELSLDILYKKLIEFFKSQNTNNYISNNKDMSKTLEIKSVLYDSIINKIDDPKDKTEYENKKYIFGNSIKKTGYSFIFSLVQAIANYQHLSRHKKIEIPIKKKTLNDEEEEYEKTEIEETINENDILLNKKNNNSIIFYYYESKYIDIILLEKIINEMLLKKNLKNYCLELIDEENYKNPEILKIFLKHQQYYNNIVDNYNVNEYKIMNNIFIRNNLISLIKKLFNNFNQEDFTEIDWMKYFMYKRMGEIYNNEEIKVEDDIDKKNFSLIDYLKTCEEENNPELNKINLINFFELLIYIYPKYEKKLCLLYYKIGFKILYSKCYLMNNKVKKKSEPSKEVLDLEETIRLIIFIFNRKSNRILMEDKYVFNAILLGMRELYKNMNHNGVFVLKHFELIKEFLCSFDFILGHLSKDFKKLVNFMKRPENLNDCNKYRKKKYKLEITLDFLKSLINFKKNYVENVLTDEIIKFQKEIIERVINLIFPLLEIDKEKSIEIINILLDFIFEFIKGPDIENINMLFSLGFLKLVSFVITNLDYYKLFLNHLKKDNMHEVIDNFSIIECKIIKIFIAYYNISYSPFSTINEFEKLQHWYENNFKYIKKKLKKLYYISEIEMEKREYIINKMLLFIKEKDIYSDEELIKRAGILITEDDEDNNNEDENENYKNDENKKKSDNFCIIKFDLLLSYYTLFNYYKDLSDIEEKNAFSHLKKSKKNIFYWIINFFIDLALFLINLVIVTLFFLYFFFKRFSANIKKDVDLLQRLSEIDVKSEAINENKIINFLKNYIKEVEVSINKVIYKVYFPMIDKANTLLEYRKEYLKVDQIDSSDFTNYLLSNYDYIDIKAKQNALVNKWINEFPILNYVFKNMYIYGVLLIILGLLSNLLIVSSYNTFVERDCIDEYKFKRSKQDVKLQCPRFFYEESREPKNVVLILKAFITIEIILQGMTFFDYIIRLIAVESEIVKLNYEIKKLKILRQKTILKINKFTYLLHIAIPTIGRSFLNFKTIYYIISLLCLSLGIGFHPFFNCIILLEFVNRIQLMQAILKAMYRPAKNILITLLMFIILEYFFSFFAVSWFTYHFPNETDTKNFLKTFMRMMDQTFKQDGGIGTYLDKSLDDDFMPFSPPAYINLRFFFDLIFFLVILLLIFQMFLSIIIDYFNETRENNENFEETLETQCIVCGIEREKIEKINSNEKNAFDKHIKYYHNVFNYIYYLMYLQSSSSKDVIIDNSVWNLHLEKNLSYLPKNICFKQLEKKCWKKLNQSKNEDEI